MQNTELTYFPFLKKLSPLIPSPTFDSIFRDEKILLLQEQEYIPTVLNLINAARSSVRLMLYQIFYYKNETRKITNRFNHAILAAHARGATVRFITNRSFPKPLFHQYQNHALNQFARLGIQTAFLRDKRCLHAKTMVIDAQVIVLGSHNWSETSLKQNLEFSVAIRDKKTAQAFCNSFDVIWQEKVVMRDAK